MMTMMTMMMMMIIILTIIKAWHEGIENEMEYNIIQDNECTYPSI